VGSPVWRIGLAVASCRRDTLVLGYNCGKSLVPASCAKLLITACALERWSPAFARELDSCFGTDRLRSHVHRANRSRVDSLGLNAHPEFPGYRHLVLANRESDNREAEWMLALMSRSAGLDGHSLVARFLDRLGIARGGLRVWDASGLSRRNRVAPATIAGLLSRVLNSPTGALFHSTLARPGQAGTLVNRNLDAGQQLAAKTGYIRDVFSLSGYLAAARDTYAFSFIVNGCGSGARAYALFNRLLNAVSAWDAGLAPAPAQPADTARN
jgi:D-alanyl-D-alanine carboxypeptidase